MTSINFKAFLISFNIVIIILFLFKCVTAEADWLDKPNKWTPEDDSSFDEFIKWAYGRCDISKNTVTERLNCYICCLQKIYPPSHQHALHNTDCFNTADFFGLKRFDS